ncbi:uncharacterized protein LOC131224253 [Magnolia sinica]|uniref:uncharacterized protein LOC131224253 n=1 Tax=Magnolia sinica TaxID=86752 RepID=UPI00265A5696|nr:uncharacterized protein LOC131224253 [Magnolia sinica]
MSWMKSDYRQATSKLASELVVNRIKQRLGLRPKDIIFAIQEKYNIVIGYQKAWRTKEIAIDCVMGSYEDSYKELTMYLHELRMANPGKVTTLLVNKQTMRFERCFVALGQCVKSFQTSLQRVLTVDGTHLKDKYKGVLFVTTALDGDNHIFPVTFGIRESKNNSSWNWFLTYINDSLGDCPGLVIISDRHKGLMKKVPQVFQTAIHRYCMYHIYRNLVDTFKDKSLEIYYWQAAKTYRKAKFEKLMHDIEHANPPVHAWLREIGYEKWTSSYFSGKRFNLVTTNIAECVIALFNEA